MKMLENFSLGPLHENFQRAAQSLCTSTDPIYRVSGTRQQILFCTPAFRQIMYNFLPSFHLPSCFREWFCGFQVPNNQRTTTRITFFMSHPNSPTFWFWSTTLNPQFNPYKVFLCPDIGFFILNVSLNNLTVFDFHRNTIGKRETPDKSRILESGLYKSILPIKQLNVVPINHDYFCT